MSDKSTHPTVVEYAVQEMFKRKSPKAAAEATRKKLHGHENMFMGGLVEIGAQTLEAVLWERLVEFALKTVSKFKPGFEEMAIESTADYFRQGAQVRKELIARVRARLHR